VTTRLDLSQDVAFVSAWHSTSSAPPVPTYRLLDGRSGTAINVGAIGPPGGTIETRVCAIY